MIDFNNAELQGSGGAGPIPEDSNILFKMTIRPPRAGKEGTFHNLFCKSGKGNEFIDVEFEACGANFAGRKVWQNFTLAGSEQATAISMRTLRAIIESARGIRPDDNSPQATAGRQITDWADFNSMTFLAKVGAVAEQNQKDGKWYVNNTIKKIVTPDMAEYEAGEVVSDKALPVLPEATSQPAAAAATVWGAGAASAAPAVPPTQQSSKGPMPSWAAK